jgi:lauroyl/myristoyl acyltransferase
VSESIKERLAYHAYASAARLARGLPERAGRVVFDRLALLAHAVLPRVRTTVERNQAQVLGLPVGDALVRRAGKEAFALYARYWLDTFRARDLTPEGMERRFDGGGREHVDAALERGKGCIIVLPHMGNWDVAGQWMAMGGYPIAAVAEELRPPRLFELFLRHREELGMRIVGLTRNANVGRQLAKLLGDNWVVALVADRDLSGRGTEVEMFGRVRRVPAGPALLSITTGAPLLVASVNTTPNGWRCRIGPPLEIERTDDRRTDVMALTRCMSRQFERAIAAWPTDWHMFQPAWDA